MEGSSEERAANVSFKVILTEHGDCLGKGKDFKDKMSELESKTDWKKRLKRQAFSVAVVALLDPQEMVVGILFSPARLLI